MSWKPIIAGVDGSPESATAASTGAELAERAGTRCELVHAVRDPWIPPGVEPTGQATPWGHALIADARARVMTVLAGSVGREMLDRLTVRSGRTPHVLQEAVSEHDASLVVLGGKHHSLLGRWFAGSTSIDVVRTSKVPVLITRAAKKKLPARVLAAVDSSAEAARATIDAAERIATLVGAELRVLSVLEPLPVIPDVPNYDLTSYYAMLEGHLAHEIWPLVRASGVRKTSRYGMPAEEISREVSDWSADLLVVGSHGKDWIDRLLIGSATERLLNQLPTSMLVVPLRWPASLDEPGWAEVDRHAAA